MSHFEFPAATFFKDVSSIHPSFSIRSYLANWQIHATDKLTTIPDYCQFGVLNFRTCEGTLISYHPISTQVGEIRSESFNRDADVLTTCAPCRQDKGIKPRKVRKDCKFGNIIYVILCCT